uniref:Uncharacterized protein n=1 Tax=Ditylenchus dipsaci TaxID=166011 RepID=A0A915D0N8_9BILA
MLTVPLTSIAENNHKGGVWSFGRSVKDWMADRIATNVLMNRLDPHGSSDSSSSESDSEEEEEDIRLVESVTEPLVHAAATVSIVGEEGDKTYLPKISIHEGTPDSCVVYAAVIPPTKDSTPCTSRKSSSKKKRRGTLKHASMNPFANYSQSTMRAIQAIETGKMRAYRNNDFKSRLFAKFATNDRLAKMGQNTEPKKMVSCSMQTTPVASPLMQRQRNLRSAYATRINPLLESMDSTSSEVGPNGEWTSTSIFDVDSLCSAGYLDLSFGGYSTYSTDSVPRMLAESNTPQGTVKAQQIEQIRSRRFPTFGYGFAQKVVDETSGGPSCSSMPLPFPVSNGRSKTHSIMSGARRLGSASPPVVQAESLPPGSAVGTTPRISLTDVDSLTQSLIIKTQILLLPPLLQPPLRLAISNTVPDINPAVREVCPNRRRFSANNCLAIPNENLGIKQTGETSGPSSAPVAGIVKCPSCHHFSSLIPPPVDTFTGCPHHPSPAGKPPSTKIYAKNSVGEIDWETIRRVRDACGLLPSDFLVHHANEQTPKEAIKNDDSGYSQSNAHSSPASSVPSSPYVMSKDRNKEMKPENKEEVISISNVVVEDVLEEILQKICDLKDVPNET